MIKRELYASYRFWVEIDGITEATFSDCSGLQSEITMEPLEEGGLNGYIHHLPGRVKSTNLTLKRGIATTVLWDWYSSVAQGKIERRNLSIMMVGFKPNQGAAKQVRWDVFDVLPVKWQGPALKADSNEVAVETIELVYTYFAKSSKA